MIGSKKTKPFYDIVVSCHGQTKTTMLDWRSLILNFHNIISKMTNRVLINTTRYRSHSIKAALLEATSICTLNLWCQKRRQTFRLTCIKIWSSFTDWDETVRQIAAGVCRMIIRKKTLFFANSTVSWIVIAHQYAIVMRRNALSERIMKFGIFYSKITV